MTYTFGIDVSHWEPNVDWERVKAGGVRFVFAKASQGIVKDDRFEAHRAGARAAGIPFGGYHFYDPRYSGVGPKRQAEFFWEIMQADPGQLPLVVDIEKYTAGPWHGWKYWYDFLERLKEVANPSPQPSTLTGTRPEGRGGREIMIYTGFYFWRDEGGPASTDLPQHEYFSQYPLWLAYYPYGAHPPTTTPEAQHLIPQTWKEKGWTFWQTSDQFTLDGVTTETGGAANVDYDFFNGDEAAFHARFNVDPTTPQPPSPQPSPDGGGSQPPTEEPMEYDYSLTPDMTNGNSIRTSHDVPVSPDNKIGALPYGKFAYGNETWGDGVTEYWLHVLEVDGAAIDGWIASIHNGKKIATIRQIGTTPPPAGSPTVDVAVRVSGGAVGLVYVNEEEYVKK